jgi:adenylosuccinate synthase
LLEGTQGTGLSLHHANWPYVTSRETTASGCLADAGIAPGRVRRVIMVTRTYPIRVGGTSGPMKLPIEAKVIADRSGLPLDKIDKTEVGTISGTKRRIAEFDWEQLRRSSVLNGATDIALTLSVRLFLLDGDLNLDWAQAVYLRQTRHPRTWTCPPTLLPFITDKPDAPFPSHEHRGAGE